MFLFTNFLVLDQITKPSDLKSLSLACRIVSTIVTPLLYENLILDSGDDIYRMVNTTKQVSMSNNLRFVRTIKIKSFPLWLTDVRMFEYLRILISNLPEHSLKRMDYTAEYPPWCELMDYLRSHQENICNFIFDERNHKKTHFNTTQGSSSLPSHANFSEYRISHTLLSTISVIFTYVSGIHSPMDHPKHMFFGITHLHFHDWESHSGRYPPLDQFPSLTDLTLQDCNTLGWALYDYLHPIVKHLRIQTRSDTRNTGVDFEELILLLHRFKGLSSFALVTDRSLRMSPAHLIRLADGIEWHKDTLERFIFNDSSYIDETYDLKSSLMQVTKGLNVAAREAALCMLRLVMKCKKLSHLEIPFCLDGLIDDFQVSFYCSCVSYLLEGPIG